MSEAGAKQYGFGFNNSTPEELATRLRFIADGIEKKNGIHVEVTSVQKGVKAGVEEWRTCLLAIKYTVLACPKPLLERGD